LSKHKRRLCLGQKALNWHIGDWWAFGDHRYGERAKAAAEGIFGREFQTLVNLGNVSNRFESNRRRLDLSWSHHAEVAALPPAKADALLDQAEAGGWSTRELRARIPGRTKSDAGRELIKQKAPTIALEIETEAARIGSSLPSFLALLIALGWEQYRKQGSP